MHWVWDIGLNELSTLVIAIVLHNIEKIWFGGRDIDNYFCWAIKPKANFLRNLELSKLDPLTPIVKEHKLRKIKVQFFSKTFP